MPKIPGRKLIRSPFPSDQSPQTTDLPFHGEPGEPVGADRALASIETQKNSVLVPDRSPSKSFLAERETQKNPVIKPNSGQDKGLFLANAMTHYVTAQKNP